MYQCIRRRQVPPQTVQELTDALIQVWEEIPHDTIRRLIRSMPRRCWECIQAHGDQTHYWVILWVGSAVISIFYFDFRCDFGSSPQWVDGFGFHWLLVRHFVLNSLNNVRQLRCSTWIICSSRSDVWFKCSLNFFKQCVYTLYIYTQYIHYFIYIYTVYIQYCV